MTTDTLNLTTNTKPSRRTPWVLGLLLIVVAVLGLGFLLLKPVKVLPVVVPAPTYQLVDQHGQPFSSDDLHGKVVLYDFIYTSCTTVCPAMTGQMLQMQRQFEAQNWLGSDVELVTISFDPTRDTPERLASYAESVNADETGWHWLTGDSLEIKQLVGGEFGVYFEQVPLDASSPADQQEEGYDFVHSTVFVIVDENGDIRAEYQQMLDIEQTMRDVGLVVREKNAGPLLIPVLRLAHAIRAYP